MECPESRHSAFNSLSKANSTWAHQMFSAAPGDGFPSPFPSPLGNLKEAPVPRQGLLFCAHSKAYEWPKTLTA